MIEDLGKLINDTSATGINTRFKSLGDLISTGYEVALTIAGFLAFFWFVWGAFQYITAGGDKEGLAKARARITWAIIGLIFIILAYFIARFAVQILNPRGGAPL